MSVLAHVIASKFRLARQVQMRGRREDVMTRVFRRTRRLGLLTLLVCAAVATVGVANAAADVTISGTATGKTIPLGNGSFRIVGTYVDPATPGVGGVYDGTYTELTSGYTSCNDKIFCAAFT